jgi:hypothetical protein
MVQTGGKARHPVATERLKHYWARGAGAAKIKWGVPGDFNRCVLHIQKAVTDGGAKPLPDHEIKGLCASLHHRALGVWPGQEHG